MREIAIEIISPTRKYHNDLFTFYYLLFSNFSHSESLLFTKWLKENESNKESVPYSCFSSKVSL